MPEPIRVIHYGLGPIGALIARTALERSDFQAVGAIDIHPDLAGRDLDEVLGIPATEGVKISGDAASVLRETEADLVLHSTGSYIASMGDQIIECVDAGVSVVSTCEELAYPWVRHPEWSKAVDCKARKKGVSVLGCGINPGFMMDLLPLAVSGVCKEVRRVEVRRVVNAGERREPLQRKVGAGLSRGAFEAMVSAGKVRHVGLEESVLLLAAGLGWKLDEAKEERTASMIAEERIRTDYLTVEPGDVTGVHQIATGIIKGEEKIRLTLQMYVGAKDPGDFVTLEGTPPIQMAVRGVHGDISTAAVTVNAARRVSESKIPGLLTMKDIPVISWHQPF